MAASQGRSQGPSLSEIVTQHRKTSQQLRSDLDKERQDLVKTAEELGQSIIDKLDKGVGKTYENQRRLEVEAKTLERKVVDFAKEINQWTTLYSQFNDALKELGDVKNWAQGIEADLNDINLSLTKVVSESQKRSNSTRSTGEEKNKPAKSS
eukprot:jgi/Bigna1/132158/aug1.16_g6866